MSSFHRLQAYEAVVNGRPIRTPHGSARRVSCALAGLLFFAGQLHALEPTHSLKQYAHSAWNGQVSSVRALAQTTDGTLWIGTDSGLLRFDGVRFRPWRPPAAQQLASEHITALSAARDGSLWIGTREGLSRWKGAEVENYQTSKSSAGPSVTAIIVDGSGTVWAGTAGYDSGGLCRVEGNRLRCYGTADGLPGPAVLSLHEDRAGSLWVGGVALTRWRPGTPRVYSWHDQREIYSIIQDRQGEIWVAGRGLNRLVDGQLVPYPIASAPQKLRPWVLLPDRDGGLWIGTRGQGVIRLYQGRIGRFTQDDGLSSDIVNSLLEDREGNIWVGTDAGLDRFREFAVNTISKREGLSQNAASSVFSAKDGGVWIGTEAGLNRVTADGRILVHNKRDGLPSGNIWGGFEDQAGRTWVVTADGLAYSDRGRFWPFNLPLGKKMSFVAATEDRDHTVWFSDPQNGLIRLQDTRIVEIVPWSRFQNRQAWALEPDDGGIWLGFAQGGVAYYKPGQPVRWLATPGQAGRKPVMDMQRTSDGSLWIATQAGLSRLQNGHLAPVTVANGLPCESIRAMLQDDGGNLWLDTPCGIVRISFADLSKWCGNPACKLRVRVYDAGDGLRRGATASGYFPRAAKSKDGRLWFAVFDGVAVIDPKHLPENRLPPPVQIEEITAGQSEYSIVPKLRLPALTKELRIDYTALSFVDPDKVRFRYRLDGFDREWYDAAGRRQAVYTNLPPKQYRFRVLASNNDGVWNEQGASVAFSIDPAFYQTIWFRLLSVSAFAVLLWSLHRLRLRQMGKQIQVRFHERLGERTRIAREMHDTLIQNLCGFSLQLEGLAKNATIPVSARASLREIRAETERCFRGARAGLGLAFARAARERPGRNVARGGRADHFRRAGPVSYDGTRRPSSRSAEIAAPSASHCPGGHSQRSPLQQRKGDRDADCLPRQRPDPRADAR